MKIYVNCEQANLRAFPSGVQILTLPFISCVTITDFLIDSALVSQLQNKNNDSYFKRVVLRMKWHRIFKMLITMPGT